MAVSIIPFATILTLDYVPGINYSVSYQIDVQIEDQHTLTYTKETYMGKFQIPNNISGSDGVFMTKIVLSGSGVTRNVAFRYNANKTIEVILKYSRTEEVEGTYKQFYICDFSVHKTENGILKNIVGI